MFCKHIVSNVYKTVNGNIHTNAGLHAKYLRRRVLRTMTTDEADQFNNKKQKQSPVRDKPELTRWNYKQTQTHSHSPINYEKRERLAAEGKFIVPEHIRYEQIRKGDTHLSTYTMKAKSRALRHEEGLIFLEGKHLIRDALHAGATIKRIYFSKIEHLKGLPLNEMNTGASPEVAFFKVNYEQLRIWSDVSVAPGIIAIACMPTPDTIVVDAHEQVPVTLLCDKIRDPGNMGTLIRTAAAVGCQRVIVTKGCVDVWDTKVLRSGMGAHFRVEILSEVAWETVPGLLGPQSTVYMADCMPTTEGHQQRRGHRGHDTEADVHRRISEVESQVFTEVDEETGSVRDVDESYRDPSVLDLYTRVTVPTCPYDTPTYHQGEPVVIIGGEVDGLSAAAHKVCYDRGGEKVYIPMMCGINSLNAGVAASIVLYEIRRQFDRRVQSTNQEAVEAQS